MDSKKWIASAFMFSALFIFTIATFNIWLDPYGIVHKEKRLFITQPNLNFLKTHYVITHPSRYRNFLFGSSRVGNINPFHLEEPLFYNMTYPDAIPRETLDNLQRFLNAGVKIDTVLLGLDEFNTQISYRQRQYQGLTHAYPEDSFLAWFELYRFYFLKFPNKLDISVFKQRLLKNNPGQVVGIEDQKRFFDLFDHLNVIIDQNISRHVADAKFKRPTKHNAVADHDPLLDIQEIISLCRTNGIRLIIFTNPIHHTDYARLDRAGYQTFKTELQKQTSFYDFSGPNTVTENNYYFYETTHYRPMVGELILETIFQDKQFKDFGTFVQKGSMGI